MSASAQELVGLINWREGDFTHLGIHTDFVANYLGTTLASDVRPGDIAIGGSAVRNILSVESDSEWRIPSLSSNGPLASVTVERWAQHDETAVRVSRTINDGKAHHNRSMLANHLQRRGSWIPGVHRHREQRIAALALEVPELRVEVYDATEPHAAERRIRYTANVREQRSVQLPKVEVVRAAQQASSMNYDGSGLLLDTLMQDHTTMDGPLIGDGYNEMEALVIAQEYVDERRDGAQTMLHYLTAAVNVVRLGRRT